jgi:hypothetical protein
MNRDYVAWRGALIAALLNVVGWPFELLMSRGDPGVQQWPALVGAGVGLAIAIVLVVARRRCDARLASILFLVNSLSIAACLAVVNWGFANGARPWSPFQANKLGILTVGLLTPELWVGLVSIAAYTGSALVEWTLFSPEVRHHVELGEPWATAVIGLFGVVLLIQSVRRYDLEFRAALAEANAHAAERLARTLLGVRDFANTPLQTITATAAELAERHPELRDQNARMMRAIDRLRELNRLLSKHEAEMDWRDGAESFDPERLLDQS